LGFTGDFIEVRPVYCIPFQPQSRQRQQRNTRAGRMECIDPNALSGLLASMQAQYRSAQHSDRTCAAVTRASGNPVVIFPFPSLC
jgi:hypothetical protein